jgi:hypothetical protein
MDFIVRHALTIVRVVEMALLVTHARTDIFSTVKIANCALLA